ncbi:MAG: hypothetical protein AB7S99_04670, partial [Pseudodonghicola sp.]
KVCRLADADGSYFADSNHLGTLGLEKVRGAFGGIVAFAQPGRRALTVVTSGVADQERAVQTHMSS